jgi:uncharacterized membrane protein YhaH (DUF805 family)
MNWLYLFNSFHGRIGRQAFWFALILTIVAQLAGQAIADQLQGDRLSAIVDLVFTYPQFAVTIKRAHDRNMPDWVLIAFFAANAFLDLLVVLDLAGTNEHPNLLSLAVAIPLTVVGVALLVELGLRKGTEGPNQYGPDPLQTPAPPQS